VSPPLRFHFVVNPVAGRGRAVSTIGAVEEALRASGHATSRHVTARPGDGAAHVAGLEADALDRLVVVGGDGTLREVVNARPLPMPWPVGIVPMGTANLAGRELRMPRSCHAGRIAERLAGSTDWPVDVLQVTGTGRADEVAVSLVGAGLDGELVRTVSGLRADAAGAGGYKRWLAPMWDTLRGFRFPRLRVTVDGRCTYAAAACVVQNAYSYGGLFALSPDAALDSGQLDVFMVRARTHRDLFRIMCGSFLRRVHHHRDVKIVRGTEVRIRAGGAIPVQADGDPAGTTDLSVRLRPKAMTLLRA
jgi:diacylglycerol kinase family enzyme